MGSTSEDYFGRLTKLWDSMAECLTTKSFSCEKCQCKLETAHEIECDTICVHDFLFGLDDGIHGSVRSQICAQIPLLDLDTVYQTIVQNEMVRLITRVENTPVMTFAAQTSSPKTRNNNGAQRPHSFNPDANTTCTSCGRKGHTGNSCFRVIGFLKWWGEQPRNRINVKGGHENMNSGVRNSGARANSTQVVGTSMEIGANVALTEADRQGLIRFSDTQWW
ncbi:unnamed protein product [Microthlaspi erraticum]|uniref:CCHC-type domain-containing protein n=1 Tax=Microthlaspi erraticum TaxID=1685480 RepID=A0A6D2HUM7_9BRAS|nr:unnamed protein product [Microthlaspi erraticum]